MLLCAHKRCVHQADTNEMTETWTWKLSVFPSFAGLLVVLPQSVSMLFSRSFFLQSSKTNELKLVESNIWSSDYCNAVYKQAEERIGHRLKLSFCEYALRGWVWELESQKEMKCVCILLVCDIKLVYLFIYLIVVSKILHVCVDFATAKNENENERGKAESGVKRRWTKLHVRRALPGINHLNASHLNQSSKCLMPTSFSAPFFSFSEIKMNNDASEFHAIFKKKNEAKKWNGEERHENICRSKVSKRSVSMQLIKC